MLVAGCAESLRHLLIAVAGESTHVAGEVDRVRLGFGGELGDLPLRGTVADHQAAAPGLERLIQVGQALEQELGARPGGVAASQEPVVGAEDRDEMVGLIAGGFEGGVIVDAEVAPEPEDSRACHARISFTAA